MSDPIDAAVLALYNWVKDNGVEIKGATPSMMAQVAASTALKRAYEIRHSGRHDQHMQQYGNGQLDD